MFFPVFLFIVADFLGRMSKFEEGFAPILLVLKCQS